MKLPSKRGAPKIVKSKKLIRFTDRKLGIPKLHFKKLNNYYKNIIAKDGYRREKVDLEEIPSYDPTFKGLFDKEVFETLKLEIDEQSYETNKTKHSEIYSKIIKVLETRLFLSDLSDNSKEIIMTSVKKTALSNLLVNNYTWIVFNCFRIFHLSYLRQINFSENELKKNERYYNMIKSQHDRTSSLFNFDLDVDNIFNPLKEHIWNKIRNGTIKDLVFSYIYLHNDKYANLKYSDKIINNFIKVKNKFSELKKEYLEFKEESDLIFRFCLREYISYVRENFR